MDLNQFIRLARPRWERLEELLEEIDRVGMRGLDVEQAREFAALYRRVGMDLMRARSLTANRELLAYINGLVGRAYGHIYTTQRFDPRQLWRFVSRGYPRLVRRELRAIVLATAIFMSGAAFGAGAMVVDPDAGQYVLPKQHVELNPAERVADLERDMANGEGMSADQQAYFSSYLFTHNIQVTFLVFALGLTFGVGTCIVLFFNGLVIGALGAQYHMEGVGTFFYAWIMPHGVPELTSIFIAGGAGLVLGRALWNPGRRSRLDQLRQEAPRAVRLILGTTPLLVVAGIIEGTISQMHPPVMPYAVKLGVAGTMAVLLALYLGRAGRSGDPGGSGDEEGEGR